MVDPHPTKNPIARTHISARLLMMIAIDVSCGERDLSPTTAALQPPTALRDEFPGNKRPVRDRRVFPANTPTKREA